MKNKLLWGVVWVLFVLVNVTHFYIHFSKPIAIIDPPVIHYGLLPPSAISNWLLYRDLTTYFPAEPPHVPIPADHPPLRIIAGGSVYKITYTTAEWLHRQHFEAMTEYDEHEIIVHSEESGAMRETIVHELLHIAKQEGTHSNKWMSEFPVNTGQNDDHEYIESSTLSLLRILRNNPKLVKWLTDLNYRVEGE